MIFRRLFLGAAALLVFSSSVGATDKQDVPALVRKAGEVMEKEAARGFWGTVLVAKSGRPIFQEGYGFADRRSQLQMPIDAIIDSGSLSKQVTATAAVLLETQGKLSLDDSLNRFFPSVPPDKAEITVRQLLSHTAGFHWAFPHDFIPIPQSVWLQKVFSAPLKHPPGTKFYYSNDGFTLAAMIIETVTGQQYQDYIRETFFEPLAMERSGWYDDEIFDDPNLVVATGYYNEKDSGAPNEWSGPFWALLGNGGILWTPSDALKWHRAVHGDLLPSEAKALLFEPVVPMRSSEDEPAQPGPAREYYALGWAVTQYSCKGTQIRHGGAGTSHNVDYRYFPEHDLLIYVASNRIDEDYERNEVFYAEKAATALVDSLYDECSEADRK